MVNRAPVHKLGYGTNQNAQKSELKLVQQTGHPSYFYHNLPYEEGEEPDWLVNIEEYSRVNSLRVYLLKNPVVDSGHEEYEKHFLLLASGFQLCIVEEPDSENFESFEEDIKGFFR